VWGFRPSQSVCFGFYRTVRPRSVRQIVVQYPLAHTRIVETATTGSYIIYRDWGADRQTERVRESRRRRRRCHHRYRWRWPGDLLVCFGNAPQTVVSPLAAHPLPSYSLPSMSVRRRRRRRRRRRDTCAVFHCSFAALRPRFVPNRKDDFCTLTFTTLEI